MKDVRAEYFKLMEAKSVDAIVKFGAMLAAGLIDAGQRICEYLHAIPISDACAIIPHRSLLH